MDTKTSNPKRWVSPVDTWNLNWKQAVGIVVSMLIAGLILIEVSAPDNKSVNTNAARMSESLPQNVPRGEVALPPLEASAGSPPQSPPAAPQTSSAETCWRTGECLKTNEEDFVKYMRALAPFLRDGRYAPDLPILVDYAKHEHDRGYLACASNPSFENKSCLYYADIIASVAQVGLVFSERLGYTNGRQIDSTAPWSARIQRDLAKDRELVESETKLGFARATYGEEQALIQQIDDWNRRTQALLDLNPNLNAWLANANASIRLDTLNYLVR